MRPKLFCFTLLVLIALGTPASSPAQYLNPKIASKETVIHTVQLLPAKIEIVRNGMRGPEGMTAQSELVSARIIQAVVEVFAAKHINATAASILSANDADNQKKYALADIQSSYDSLLVRINKKPGDVKKGRFSLGDQVLNLNLDKSTDAIVFVRGRGQVLSKGKKAFSILTLSPNFSYLMMTIGIIDAHTGEVLSFTKLTAAVDATDQNERSSRKEIEQSLKKLPANR